MIGRRASLLALRRRPLSDPRRIPTLPQIQNPSSISAATESPFLGLRREFGGFGERRNGFGVRGYATRRMTESSNRPPNETILLDGCDFEHWLVVVEKPEDGVLRDEIIDGYIKTLAQVVGSEEEARMKIYSVSTKHYFAFELPNVRWVLPDSYFDVPNKTYGGEPFINGQAVPYDPKYHEVWVRNHANSLRNNEKNRLKQQGNRRTTSRTPPSSPPYGAGDSSQSQGTPNNNWSPPASSQNQSPQPSQVLNQSPSPQTQPSFSHSHAAHTPVHGTSSPNQAPRASHMQDQRFVQPPPAAQPSYGPTRADERRMPPSAPEPSYMRNQLPPNQTYTAPSHGGPTWNSQNQNWSPLPDFQNHGQQVPASNSNPSGWNSPPPTTYSPSQNEPRARGIGYAVGDRNQNMQPAPPQMPFQPQTHNPPSHGTLPPQQRNYFPSGNTSPTSHTNGFQNSYPPQSGQNNGYWTPPQQPQQQSDFRSGNISPNYSFQSSYPSQSGQNHGYQSHGMNQGGYRDVPRSNTSSAPGWDDQSRVPIQNRDVQNNGVAHYVQSSDPGNGVNLQNGDSHENVMPGERTGDVDQTHQVKERAASG
ncbi:Multiple organellar RNA editing factor 8, chloroplastic/mitochondrial-like protein [Drosera capensis]